MLLRIRDASTPRLIRFTRHQKVQKSRRDKCPGANWEMRDRTVLFSGEKPGYMNAARVEDEHPAQNINLPLNAAYAIYAGIKLD